MSYVDGAGTVTQKTRQLQSMRDRPNSFTEEEGIIAYSNKRKVNKNLNARTLGMKGSSSPKGLPS